MFDVIWTDPNVELMGQRILRKEQEAKEKEQNKAKRESGRQSVRTSGSASSGERRFALFSAKSRWKGSATPRKKPSPSVNSQEYQEPDDAKASRTSMYGVKAALSDKDQNETLPPISPGPSLSANCSEPEVGNLSSPRDSVLSRWAQQAADETGAFDKIEANELAPKVITESYIQKLDTFSTLTQTIETKVSLRTEADTDQPTVETHISSEGVPIQEPPSTESPEDVASNAYGAESSASPQSCPHTPPPIHCLGHPVLYVAHSHNYDRSTSPEAWRPPHEWDCTPTKQIAVNAIDEHLQAPPTRRGSNNSAFPAFSALVRERRMMATASTELMLVNLKSSMGEASDASVYKELEMTKKRWLFSALHQLGGYARLVERPAERPTASNSPRRVRILALYETHASASFITARYPKYSVTHLSQSPLSPDIFPNIRPLLVPSISVSASSRVLPPRLYSSVTCLSMPALFPSTDIPPFLRHINKCLAPGGALHLTVIDPQPVSTSMGPKLRQWLFTNLLINLEQAFRTTWPSETFPAWLAIGDLRGKGSTIATTVAPAIYEGNRRPDAKTELRCLVTRLLWQEVWGRFVTASQWWWEEEEIVQECIELETHWQYSHIVAVKGDCQ
ncbi:hypothetical protein F4777DRAFT_597908 [Nemania sp. FL0916]|nr:hypothetical protein F4777DRAFT_597908 [Nemania sp. FL0916]